jgi:stage II sporulation protein P
MKKLKYLSAFIIIGICLSGVIFSNGLKLIMPYITKIVINELLPFNLCGQIKTSLMCELLPGCKVAYIYDIQQSVSGEETVVLNQTIITSNSNETQQSVTDSSEAAGTQENVTENSAETTEEDLFDASAVETLVISNTDGMVSGPEPINYSMAQLMDFDTLLSECYVVDSSTTVTEDELDAEKLLSFDMGIDTSGEDIKVLIYHTHGSESFSDSREGVMEDTVIGVGDELANLLENTYGIKVYHDRNIYDNINGIMDRSNAYNLAGAAIDEILAENPGIEVVLDLHRDGVNDEVKLVRTVDGRETAQIMFLNGVSRLKSSGDIEYLYNPHKEENLSFSLKLFLNGRSLYGDLIRKIYIRGYCFNLDRVARSSLIEVGAQTNTVEEAKNAMIPLARIISQVLSE